MQFRAHLHTVTRHRRLVRSYCLKLGLVWQGLTHDLSKFSPVEFWRGCKYYQGWRSPNDQERLENGVSLAWLHHKGRNRHHFEYWIDYCRRAGCRDSAQIITPFVRVRTYLTRNFATLGPL